MILFIFDGILHKKAVFYSPMEGQDSYFGGGFGIGGMLKAIYPEWPEEEKYDVQWWDVYDSSNRFRKFDYDAIADYVKPEADGIRSL